MLRNIITAFFTRSFVAVLMLVNLLIVSRYLGSAVLGQLSLLILNLAIIHSVAEIYSGSALVYFIPKHSPGKLYSSGFVWIFFCCAVMNVVIYFLNDFFRLGSNDLMMHLLVLSFLSSLHAFHNVILLGRENIRAYNFLIFFQPACMVGILFVNVFLLNITTINACLLALYASFTMSLLMSAFFVLQLPGKNLNEDLRFTAIFKNGFINQMGNLAHILSNRYNFYIIGGLSIALVGVYASATSLIESIWIISISVSPLILTHISNQKDVENNSRLTFLLAKLCFLLSLVFVVIIYFIPNEFFTAVLGKDFSQAKMIMLYLAPGALCISFSSIISHYFSGLGRQKILLLANASGLTVTLLTAYYFIYRFGILGACVAASLAYFVQSTVLTVLFMKQNNIALMDIFKLRKDIFLLRAKKTDLL